MPRHGRQRLFLAFGLVAATGLASCGNNLGENLSDGREPAVALDRNVVTSHSSDMSLCSRYPSRC